MNILYINVFSIFNILCKQSAQESSYCTREVLFHDNSGRHGVGPCQHRRDFCKISLCLSDQSSNHAVWRQSSSGQLSAFEIIWLWREIPQQWWHPEEACNDNEKHIRSKTPKPAELGCKWNFLLRSLLWVVALVYRRDHNCPQLNNNRGRSKKGDVRMQRLPWDSNLTC